MMTLLSRVVGGMVWVVVLAVYLVFLPVAILAWFLDLVFND